MELQEYRRQGITTFADAEKYVKERHLRVSLFLWVVDLFDEFIPGAFSSWLVVRTTEIHL